MLRKLAVAFAIGAILTAPSGALAGRAGLGHPFRGNGGFGHSHGFRYYGYGAGGGYAYPYYNNPDQDDLYSYDIPWTYYSPYYHH